MISSILFGGFVGFLILGLPIAFVLGLASMGAILCTDYPIEVLSQRLFTALDSFPLMAIPLFMLAGTLMGSGGITRTIIDSCLCRQYSWQFGACGGDQRRDHGRDFRLRRRGYCGLGHGHDSGNEKAAVQCRVFRRDGCRFRQHRFDHSAEHRHYHLRGDNASFDRRFVFGGDCSRIADRFWLLALFFLLCQKT